MLLIIILVIIVVAVLYCSSSNNSNRRKLFRNLISYKPQRNCYKFTKPSGRVYEVYGDYIDEIVQYTHRSVYPLS